jgi:hypothetical protein
MPGRCTSSYVGALAADEPLVFLAQHPSEARVSIRRPLPVLCRPADRADDVLVAGAPADLTGEHLADLGLGRVRVAVEQPARGHHHAGRAEAALQAVALDEPLLDRVELAVFSPGPPTVRTERPSAIAASTVHALTGVSSSHTTQLPQLDVSQPQWLPVRPSWSRRKWMSSSRGSTSRRNRCRLRSP